ncbi:MAG: HEPN domain-containing protein [Anaerolineales bacterium]|nr:HEPN domain-containing protein [Anaerolineales bacterium]MDW8445892.1 HEPN domain-containing protein [Anaerolineales bacterium]
MNRWRDWFEQAKRDLQRASLDVKYQYYEWACFTSQQAAEKAIRALGLRLGRNLWGHSLTEMLSILQETVNVPAELKEKAQLLDLYYIPPRYPNGFAAGKPADYFTEKQAREAFDAASEILRFCDRHLAEAG